MWQATKKSLQPVSGEGWYVTNGPDDIHCGVGQDGEERAKRVARLLNLGGTSLPAGQSECRDSLMQHLRNLNDAALRIDPTIVPNLQQTHPLYGVLVDLRTVKREAEEIQKLILTGPSAK